MNDESRTVSRQKSSERCATSDFIPEDDLETRQKVMAHNQNVLVNIARRYSDYGVSFSDIIREGRRGLAQAMDNFELEGSFRFAAYADRCVRQSIECSIMNQIEPE